MKFTEDCIQCGKCADFCPLGAIYFDEGKKVYAVDDAICVNSMGCPAGNICPENALVRVGEYCKELQNGSVRCKVCPSYCEIGPGNTGDCQKFMNKDGAIAPAVQYHSYDMVKDFVEPRMEDQFDPAIRKPLITGFGTGCGWMEPSQTAMKLAPLYVTDNVDGVDVVTCASEPQLGYSSTILKLYCANYIGDEGDKIFYKDVEVGMITYTGYNYDMIRIGGVRTHTRAHDGWVGAMCSADIINKKWVELKTSNGSTLKIQLGSTPIVDGKAATATEGCGGCYAADFAFDPYVNKLFRDGIVDEFISIHKDYVGHFAAGLLPFDRDPWSGGAITGVVKSGIKLKGNSQYNWAKGIKPGKGWGMTDITNPLDIIESYSPELKEGFTLLISDWDRSIARFKVYKFINKKWKEVTPHERIVRAVHYMQETAPPATIHAFLEGDVGGGARMTAVSGFPCRAQIPPQVTEAAHHKKIKMTSCGKDLTLVPGGGFELIIDAMNFPYGAVSWTPCGALVFPVEYTMRKETFRRLYQGPISKVRPLAEVLEEMDKKRG